MNAFAAGPSDTVTAFHAAITAGDKTKALGMLSPTITIYESGHVERSREEYASHHLGGDIVFAQGVKR